MCESPGVNLLVRRRGASMRYSMIVALIAALQGAAGVSLAGAAAHVEASPLLSTASQFLMLHAAAGLALAALLATDVTNPRGLRAGAFALQAGVALFSLDLVARVYLGGKLFAFAAPIGGGLTILSWLGLAVWAALSLRNQK
jgi:uncharacterized membrane protein YgdD (TMEM256/DUF423 family)